MRMLDSSSERLLLRLTYTMNRAFAFIYDQFRFPYIILCHTIGMSHVAQLHTINVFNTLRRLVAGNRRLAHTHTHPHTFAHSHRHLEAAKNKGSAKRNETKAKQGSGVPNMYRRYFVISHDDYIVVADATLMAAMV